jgi:predicted metal-binding membrane protein
VRFGGRTTVLVSLAVAVAAAWVYLLRGAGVEAGMMAMGGGQTMQMGPAWTPAYAARVSVMWAVMMVAMMLPSAAPAILRVAGLTHPRPERMSGVPATILLTAGWLVVWAGFSIAATLVQWGFDRANILSEAMASRSAAAGGLLVLAAGLYQLTPWKQRCLRQCRAPRDYLAEGRRTGAGAAVAAGLRHGIAGLGCCGVLMGLVFVGGVMNVVWIAGLTLFVLVEQLLPWGTLVSRATGAALLAWGSIALTPAIL